MEALYFEDLTFLFLSLILLLASFVGKPWISDVSSAFYGLHLIYKQPCKLGK